MHDQFLNRKIILIAFVVSISACLQIFKDQFIYWRVDIFPEIWRLWTAHWVHVGWIHFALNMLAFMCLPFIFPRARVWHFVALLLILPPLISLSFYSVHDKFHRTLILSGFCLLKIAKISLNSSFFPKPIKR